MFSVPYNQLQQENNFGLALIDEMEARSKGELACGTLFYKMYFDEEFSERFDRKRRNVCIWSVKFLMSSAHGNIIDV